MYRVTQNAKPVTPSMSRKRQKTYPRLTAEQQKLVAEHSWIAGRLAYGAKCLTGGYTGSLTREDLESIANFALCVAATRYRPDMNVKYSTYAWNTARGYIQHALRDYSRLVRTPRWVADYKTKVDELVAEGKSYKEIADMLGIDESKVLMCEMSSNNYHLSYDSRPEDWDTKEFSYETEEHKAMLLDSELMSTIRALSEQDLNLVIKLIDGESLKPEETEKAVAMFKNLRELAHGSKGKIFQTEETSCL
jgi:DNA-directed RNA polymerase specialized sigma subunit